METTDRVIRNCKACGRPVGDSFIDALNARWHREHFLCNGCCKPIAEKSFAVRDGKAYHDSCSLALCPRCAFCGCICTGRYFFDSDKVTFCEACHATTTHCAFCTRTLGAGRACDICGDPIRDGREAREHLGRMVEWVRRHGVPLRWPVEKIDLRCVPTVPFGGYGSPDAQHRWVIFGISGNIASSAALRSEI
jgi:hypothetical protein